MRRIRVLVATLGLDQHELGAMAVSRMLRDAGMEVIYGGRFNLPPMILRMAEEEDVDVIGLSCHSWEYIQYVPELQGLLKEKELDIPVVIGGSVITPADAERLREHGVAAVFGPSARGEEIVEAMRALASRPQG
ncbi:MAG: cobalamin B12-binding domain-containing protein [Thermodesulfobacteriota bacterium]